MSTEEVRLTLIGGPTLLIEMGGLRLLTDPTFDEPQIYSADAIVTEKLTSPSVTGDSLLPIDAILLSHDQHRDNLDTAGRAFLPKATKVISTLAAEGRLGGNTRGLAPWSSLSMTMPDGRLLTVTGTPARHGPNGYEVKQGDVTGFVLSIEGSRSVYVSGDTVWYPEVTEVSTRFDIGLAVLFAGAAQPHGPFNVTMNTNDAVEAAVAFRNAKIVAIHTVGWRHYTQGPQDFVNVFKAVDLSERFVQLTPWIAAGFEL